MPPDSFFAGRSEKGASPVLFRSSAIFESRSERDCPNRRPKNSMFSRTLRSAIKILAQALRHIGDAGTDRGPMRRILHVAVEDENASGLDLPRAGDDAQQRRLSDAVGPDEPDHAAGRKLDRDLVERDRGP